MTVDEDGGTVDGARGSSPHANLPTHPAASTVHVNEERQLNQSVIQMQPLFATQPLLTQQLDQSYADAGDDVGTLVASQLPHQRTSDEDPSQHQHHSTFPESQLILLATQPGTQVGHQKQQILSLAEASQHHDFDPQYYSSQCTTMDDAGNDQAFITQPMTQQCNIPETPYFGRGSPEFHPINNDCTVAIDEATGQDSVHEDYLVEENTSDAKGSTQSQEPVAMNAIRSKDSKETIMVISDRTLRESAEHCHPIVAPVVANTGYIVNTVETSQTSHIPEKKCVVVNPYAKKRPSDQISNSSSSSSILGAANDSSSLSTSTPSNHNLHHSHRINRNNVPDAGSTSTLRKPVYNPYAKTNNTSVIRRQSVASPVGTMKVATNAQHTTNLPKSNVTTNNAGNATREDSVPLGAINKPPAPSSSLPPSRRTGISISLPIYERLPSRNVSYQPAEILTVGELYRYLYSTRRGEKVNIAQHEMHQLSGREGAAGALGDGEITSIRITGKLLCVASSNPDEKDAAKDGLYDRGTYLLIGDPLETSRLLKREVIQSVQSETLRTKSNASGTVTTTPKDGLTSILKSSGNASEASVSSTEAANASSAPSMVALNSSTDNLSNAKPSAAAIDTVTIKEPNRGVLNTQKKKLVYNGGGKRLSFGGRGLGGNARGGGVGSGSLLIGGRKFVTPKRIDSTTSSGMQRVGVASAMYKGSFTRSAGYGSATNPKPEYVVQHHPSPIVPVWLGSFYSDDGLDGSVVGDLVMIMGEIITEYCVNCRVNESAICGSENKNDGAIIDDNNNNIDAGEIRGVTGAATSIASIAQKICSGHQSPVQVPKTNATKQNSFCTECTRFVRARFVKNANGTDIRLQKEALQARRVYMRERKRQLDSLIPSCTACNGIYSVGCGPL